jgi:penicillin-binding protein 1B
LQRVVLTSVTILLALAIALGLYIRSLYEQLDRAFVHQKASIPTRIYSDVTRLSPAQPRSLVEDRLRSLGYRWQPLADAPERIDFTLKPIAYPRTLIPADHPTFQAEDQVVHLTFDGPKMDALLSSIVLGEEGSARELPELYLEPELVATLSRGASEIREIVPDEGIPGDLKKAVLAVEDHRFLEHAGINWRGLARAIWVNLKSMRLAQGGSTISQQLVKLLMGRRDRNVFQKFNEVFLTIMLEARFEKAEILNRYLNEVNLGQVGTLEVHGVAEGARLFFGKKLEDLNLAEMALMAGMFKSAFYYSPYRHWDRAIERQHLVLKRMVETGFVAQEEADEAMKQPIRLAPPIRVVNKAPYFVDFARAELMRALKSRPGPDAMSEEDVNNAGFRVYTTLDMQANSAAQSAVSGGIAELEKRLKLDPGVDRLEGALASVEHGTGNIRALVGGRSYAQSTFNRILNMRRQVGSTFKPFVYLAAILKGEDPQGIPYGPAHPALDAPWTLVFDQGRQRWTPRNYEKAFLGWITFRRALAFSVNTVTARLGMEVGLDPIIAAARALGIESELPKVPSLSLGVAELSPVELLRAYATVANHGQQNELTVLRAIRHNNGEFFADFVNNPRQVVDPAAADLLASMLQTVITEGSGRGAAALGFDRPAAGKTGTTSNYRDAWFAGFTPQLTTVVWVGKDQETPQAAPSPSPSPSGRAGKEAPRTRILLTGATSALPIWARYMAAAHVGDAPEPFPISGHLVEVPVDLRTGKKAMRACPSEQVVNDLYVSEHWPRQESCESEVPTLPSETVAP